MSQILTDILEDLQKQYLQLQQQSESFQPYLQANQLCFKNLQIETDALAKIVSQDPTLLAARAGNLINADNEAQSPCAGAIVVANIHSAALELLLDCAVLNGWIESDDSTQMQIQDSEIEAVQNLQPPKIDYSTSAVALANLSNKNVSKLSELLNAAEDEFMQHLDTKILDAYSLAIQTAGSHSVFTPEDISPLVIENPLLLALRADDLVVDEVFSNDPPAGIIISSHITQMIIDHLLEIATEKGALAFDSQGQLILPHDSEQAPVIH